MLKKKKKNTTTFIYNFNVIQISIEIGITESRKKYIFQEKYKKENNSKGMGFGLTLVKKIIKSYNGKIWVEDRIKGDYSKGSNLIILIPEAIHDNSH